MPDANKRIQAIKMGAPIYRLEVLLEGAVPALESHLPNHHILVVRGEEAIARFCDELKEVLEEAHEP